MAFLGIGALLGGGIIGGLVDFGITMAASVGLSYAAQALTDKPAPQDSNFVSHFSTQIQLQSGGITPRAFLMGKTATGGLLTYFNTWGNDGETPNAYYTQVIRLSDLPIKALTGVWVNGEKCTLTTTAPTDSGGVEAPTQDQFLEAVGAASQAGLSLFSPGFSAFISNYIQTHFGNTAGSAGITDWGYPVLEYRKDGRDHLWVKFYDGTQTVGDTFLFSRVSSAVRPYESTRVGTGIAYVICTALVDDTLFSTGIPTYKFEVDGIPLYDPTRDSTNGGVGDQRYSDPSTWGGDGDDYPAVQAFNVLRGIRYGAKWFYGLQKTTQANLPAINWNAQIAKCRATVDGPDGAEPTYRSSGQFSVDAPPADALNALMLACQGKISEVGGFYKVRLGAPDSPSFFFTDDDILSTEEQSFTPFLTLADSINGITGSFPDPTQGWNKADAPAIYNTDYEAQDGSRRLLASPSFDLVPHAPQVQRLMKSALLAARRERRHNAVFPPSFWFVEPGDVGRWNSVRNGYIDKDFESLAVTDKANIDVGISLQEVDPADYDWDHNTDYVPGTSGPTTYPRPEPQGIVDWFVEGAIIKDSDGINRRPAIRMTWDGDIPGVIGVQYEVRLAVDQSAVTSGRTDQVAAGALLISQSLLPDVAYEVRGQYIPSAPRDMLWSDWLPVTTPDVKFSVLDFENGLKDLVTNYFGQTTDQINSVLQIISAVVAQQAGTNQNDKKQIINRLVATAGRLGASIDQTMTVAVGVDNALAEYKLATTALIDEHSASIEQTQTAVATIDGKLATSWAIKANVDGYITSIELLNDGTTSAFTIMADIFKIVFPGLTPKDVFQIANVNGVPQAVLRADLISDKSITAAQISVGTLTAITASFGDAQVTGKLTGGPTGKLEIDMTIGRIVGYR